MKIRNGFVSNSSSSSFVVIFPREPKSMEDVKDMLFDEGQKFYGNPYDDESWPVEMVAKTVWNNILEQTKNDISKAIKEFSSGSLDEPGAPDINDFRHITDFRKRYEAYDKECEKFAKKTLDGFLNIRKTKLQKINGDLPDFAMYIFHYADEDGSYGSALEHGDLFHKLKHIRISKH